MDEFPKNRPLYIKIHQELKSRIEAGEWGYRAMLPSELELCEVYGVSRGTIRQVLSRLEKEGLIHRERGKGTFINWKSSDRSQNSVKCISFIVPYVRDSFVSSILVGLENIARENGYTVLFHHVENDLDNQATTLRKAVQQGVTGIVLYPVNSSTACSTLQNLVKKKFPLVLVDRYIRGLYTDYVVSDNFGGGVLATQHLLSLGHKQIAFLSWLEMATSMEQRRQGYRHTMREAGIEPDPNLEMEVIGYPEVDHEAIKDFLIQPSRPTAIFTANDQLALAVQRVARSLEIRIPDELALVGFDNLEISAHLDTPLTTIAQDPIGMGSVAGELILCLINKKVDCTQRRIIPVQLIIRSSCGEKIPENLV
jgi:DNA-binding LacI/PurR family transcriptional regulator